MWPKMAWKTLTERDVVSGNSTSVRSAMCRASKLPGGESTDVDDAPAPAC